MMIFTYLAHSGAASKVLAELATKPQLHVFAESALTLSSERICPRHLEQVQSADGRPEDHLLFHSPYSSLLD